MSSKTDAVVKLSLFLIISLLSFSIGTFVGKKYSDNQHQLAQLEPSATGSANREVASVHGEEHGEARTGQMTDDEISKLAEEFVSDDEVESPAKGAVAAHGEEAKDEHGAKDEHAAPAASPVAKTATGHGAVKETAPSSVAQNIAHGEKVVEEKVEKKAVTKDRIPSSLPKDVAQYSVGKFTVQVAAYTEEAEAQRMASDLKKKGYSAFYIPADVKGKMYYRVSVGQFATQKEAQSYRTELLEKAKVSAAMVQKITQ